MSSLGVAELGVPLLPIFLAARVRLKSAPLWCFFAVLPGLDLTRTLAV
ncbi:hypothetical protein SAMN04488563_6232 [Jiangella alkaliphila]|uniref:Uncharacterized protein n=1 Tax=Jiangella alkaliphila TaxID=419479 RepID=A0A1H2LJ71_9ACTN|nr:hypothetical protein SAMN04488563_6232 [Jiangella alkaliphila]